MTRYMIRATDSDQFHRAKALVDGKARVYVTSERRLFLSTGDLSAELQQELRSTGARVTVEQPAYRPDGPGGSRQASGVH